MGTFTIPPGRKISPDERAGEDELEDLALEPRPRFRSECGTQRPCPYVSCRHHLYLDVNALTGSILLPHGVGTDVADLKETCSLDVAERDGMTLEQVGELVNLTRERIRQIEVKGLGKLRGTIPLSTQATLEELFVAGATMPARWWIQE